MQPSKLALLIAACSVSLERRKSTIVEIKLDFDKWMVPTFGKWANLYLFAHSFAMVYFEVKASGKDFLKKVFEEWKHRNNEGEVVEDDVDRQQEVDFDHRQE